MTDNKLTDEQIIKALECCRKKECSACPCYDDEIECGEMLIGHTIDFINHKNAQIEENEAKLAHQAETIHILEKALADRTKELEDSQDGHIRTAAEKDAEIERLRMQQSELIADYKQIAINAMKKFVERLEKKKQLALIANYYVYVVTVEDIDNLLKEMDGDKS